MVFNYKSKYNSNMDDCECGHKLNFKITNFEGVGKMSCPKCGIIHNIDPDFINWDLAIKPKDDRV